MIRKTASITLLTVALTAASVGCKKKNVTDDAPTETAVQGQFVEPETTADTEEAEGELRDAILALRRVHFGFDSFDLSPDSRTALNEAGAKLNNYADVHLYVEGHADAAGETEYNMTLGEKRAKAVADFLSSLGVSAERLHIVSYGKEVPLVAGSSSDAMAQNRRVDFKLMRGDIELVVQEATPIKR